MQATFDWQAAKATSPARMCTAVLVNTIRILIMIRLNLTATPEWLDLPPACACWWPR
jgi:hypothetical protein